MGQQYGGIAEDHRIRIMAELCPGHHYPYPIHSNVHLLYLCPQQPAKDRAEECAII